MKVKALAPWFGSNRLLAENVGRALDNCSWVGVPFAGGMSELAHIKARTMAVNDLHSHVVNLAAVVADPKLKDELVERLEGKPFHPKELHWAQCKCETRWAAGTCDPDEPILEWAVDYFVCAWMSRNGTAGTDGEFRAGLSMRWEAGGGDSAVRFRNAAQSLTDWHAVMRRCTFTALDVFAFLAKCLDKAGHGLYLDPPFPGPGDGYKHKFTEREHRDLAEWLACPKQCRLVCRFYDVPLIRELYPEPVWTWHHLTGRKQTNDAAPEVLIVRN